MKSVGYSGGSHSQPRSLRVDRLAALAIQGKLTQPQLGETKLIHPSLSGALGAVTTTAKTGRQEGLLRVENNFAVHITKGGIIMEKIKVYSTPT